MIRAWWVAPADMKLPHGDGRPVVMGETLKIDGLPKLCERGLHASRNPLDALGFRNSPHLVRVELSGDVAEDENKLCATERRHIWHVDATATLREFAAWCRDRAIDNAERFVRSRVGHLRRLQCAFRVVDGAVPTPRRKLA